MFIALVVLLGLTPLGLIPLGFINVTILHIPVIIGALALGLKGGLILGLAVRPRQHAARLWHPAASLGAGHRT